MADRFELFKFNMVEGSDGSLAPSYWGRRAGISVGREKLSMERRRRRRRRVFFSTPLII